MKIIKRYCIILLLGYSVTGLLGCETVKEGAKGFLGVSTRSLEEARNNAITKTFGYDYDTCHAMVKDILKRMKACVYAQDSKKHMIAIYVSEQDTTPVGVFFKQIDKTSTQVEVSSRSTYAREFISEKMFSVLDKKITIEELEAQINAKEKKEDENK